MNDRQEMINFALARMAGFTLEGSSDGDNRSIFGLIKTLIQSAPGKTLAECRKPLAAVLSIKIRDPRERFQGCKLTLLQQTITILFGDSDHLLTDKEFADCHRDKQREKLLDYLEICRRIFIAKYVPSTPRAAKAVASAEPKTETSMERAIRLARENSERGGK